MNRQLAVFTLPLLAALALTCALFMARPAAIAAETPPLGTDLASPLVTTIVVSYYNVGTPAAPTWPDSPDVSLSAGNNAAPAPADLGGDGDLDLLVGEHSGRLALYCNTEPRNQVFSEKPGFYPVWQFEMADYASVATGGWAYPALADWDDDGDLDLLLGQAHGQVHQYTNVGSNINPDWRPDGVLLTLPWTDHPHAFPALADIDGDDDYDLFVGEGGWQGGGAGWFVPDRGRGATVQPRHHHDHRRERNLCRRLVGPDDAVQS